MSESNALTLPIERGEGPLVTRLHVNERKLREDLDAARQAVERAKAAGAELGRVAATTAEAISEEAIRLRDAAEATRAAVSRADWAASEAENAANKLRLLAKSAERSPAFPGRVTDNDVKRLIGEFFEAANNFESMVTTAIATADIADFTQGRVQNELTYDAKARKVDTVLKAIETARRGLLELGHTIDSSTDFVTRFMRLRDKHPGPMLPLGRPVDENGFPKKTTHKKDYLKSKKSTQKDVKG